MPFAKNNRNFSIAARNPGFASQQIHLSADKGRAGSGGSWNPHYSFGILFAQSIYPATAVLVCRYSGGHLPVSDGDFAAGSAGHSRTRQNRVLEEKNEQLRLASNAKTEFLSRMSHDMRTPMNGILGLIELSREEPMTPQLREYLDQEEEAGRFLLSLINDTLDMNRMKAKN